MIPMPSPKLPARTPATDTRIAGGPRRSFAPTPSPLPSTTLSRALAVKGDVFAEQDLVLAGKVDGSVDLPNHALTVAQGGRLDGPVFARIVSVSGTISGDVTASELVEILPGARVDGDITTPRIYLDEDAFYQGKIDMRRADAAVRVARYRLEQRKASGQETAKN
jgi:cytoskeletal protein CcmA (bactofilin family)